MRILKYKNIFAKGDTPNWFEEVFLIKNVKNVLLWILLMTLTEKKLLKHFTKTNCKNQSKRT